MSQNQLTNHCYVCVLQQYIITFKKATSNNFGGYFRFFFTLIINFEGKYYFFVHFWHQTLIDLVLAVSILTLDMSVNNTSNSSIFHILPFHNVNLAKKLIFNPLLPKN